MNIFEGINCVMWKNVKIFVSDLLKMDDTFRIILWYTWALYFSYFLHYTELFQGFLIMAK